MFFLERAVESFKSLNEDGECIGAFSYIQNTAQFFRLGLDRLEWGLRCKTNRTGIGIVYIGLLHREGREENYERKEKYGPGSIHSGIGRTKIHFFAQPAHRPTAITSMRGNRRASLPAFLRPHRPGSERHYKSGCMPPPRPR